MPKEELINFQGKVTEILPGSAFKIKLDNEHIIIAHLSGSIRKNKIRILLGDRVDVEMTPYDITKGRIKRRL